MTLHVLASMFPLGELRVPDGEKFPNNPLFPPEPLLP